VSPIRLHSVTGEIKRVDFQIVNVKDIKNTYKRYARVYDILFGAVLRPGRKQVVRALEIQPGSRILEVGVGTGLSLALYPADAKVTGIDISREMLLKARQRMELEGLGQVEALLEMDAENMRFASDSFDKVVAMYVVSVVPNPARLITEMRRVCRPAGEIFIVNHFRSRNPVLRFTEQLLSPLSRLAGFRTDLDLDHFLRVTGLDVIEVRKTNLFGYWRVLRCRSASKPTPLATPAADSYVETSVV